MGTINWLEKLGWTEEHIEDLRYTGYSYIRQGKYDIALSFFEALTVLAPNTIYDLQILGAIHIQLNQPLKALEYFEKALKIEPNNPPTVLNLAKALFMLGKKQDAVKLLEILKNNSDTQIANTAKALLLAYN